MRADRPLPATLVFLTATLLGGCIAGNESPPHAPFEVYEYRYAGDDVFVEGHPYGFVARIHNPTSTPITVQVDGLGAVSEWGPLLAEDGWAKDTPDAPWVLNGSASILFLFQATDDTLAEERVGFSVHADNGATATFDRNVTIQSASTGVSAGDHVQTATVGLWLNGTSFYTNIADLNDDPDFPAGYDRGDFDGAPLPVYVYDANSDEQPDGSIDTCHFTTIKGYNALLKTQATDSTNARFLTPEEGYTRPGAEDHFLYGDALVFLNTVVAHDGSTGQADAAPQPTGDCFDCYRYTPDEVTELLPDDRPRCPPS